VNQGKAPIAATAKPAAFSGANIVAAREAGAPYHPPANRPTPESRPANTPSAPVNPTHASEVQPHQPAPPNTGNAKLDQKYQQQQDKLIAKQNQQHQQLQRLHRRLCRAPWMVEVIQSKRIRAMSRNSITLPTLKRKSNELSITSLVAIACDRVCNVIFIL
jgi:hypothetical protein